MFYNYNYASICYGSTTAYTTCVTQQTVPQSVLATTFPGVGRNCLFMMGFGIFNLLALIGVEYGIVRLRNRASGTLPTQPGTS